MGLCRQLRAACGTALGRCERTPPAAHRATGCTPGVGDSGASFRVKNLQCVDHTIVVPLDYANPSGQKINVYARELRKATEASNDIFFAAAYDAGADSSNKTANCAAATSTTTSAAKKYLVYLQGGPGFRAGRVTESSGWVEAALADGFRVILLDQRGTGRSTRASIGLGRLAPDKMQDASNDWKKKFNDCDCKQMPQCMHRCSKSKPQSRISKTLSPAT